MPLPPALAAKLSKRGLITAKQKPEHTKKLDYRGLSTCPNKSNVYHECNHWCESHWKSVAVPDPKYTRNMQKLLAKYPLPNYWTEVFDKGVGRYYYWNMENDLVSWLPPKHPKSVLSKSAAKLREKRLLSQKLIREETERKEKEHTKDSNEKDKDRDSDDENKSHRSKYSDKRIERDREDRRSRRDDRYRGKRPKHDQLDPMDPAAYSDIPQGTWSDGLESNKARADNTASGVLYQQRPYPAPGEVLAANKEKSKKK